MTKSGLSRFHSDTYSAVGDPAVVTVVLRAAQLRGQLPRVDVGVELRHRTQHHHLHFELILVELEQEVRQSPLEERRGTQHQNQVQVPGESALGEAAGGQGSRLKCLC